MTLITSCNKVKDSQKDMIKNKNAHSEADEFNKNLQLKFKEYNEKMSSKGITFKSLGDCDDSKTENNSNLDLIIEKEKITESELNINFKFLQACCQTFVGDYNVKNDTLIFEYENIGGICTCECWYGYELRIKNIKEKFKNYKIIHK
jgi:hypothetical protein